LSVLHTTRAPPPPTSISHHELSTSEFWERKRRERAAAAVPPKSVIQVLTASMDAAKREAEAEKVRVPPHAEERVPLYNGVVLFPERVQRARLHALLTRILGVEGAWRFSAAARSREENEKGATRKSDKGSHAFLVCASDEVDVAALGIALWRIRMWEGGGWRRSSVDLDEEEEQEEWWPWVEIRARNGSSNTINLQVNPQDE
jgi:hypothetical protein